MKELNRDPHAFSTTYLKPQYWKSNIYWNGQSVQKKGALSVIYGCLTNYSKTQWCKTIINTYNLWNFCEFAVWETHGGVVLAWGLSWGWSSNMLIGCYHQKTWWVGMIFFQGSSFTQLTSWHWLLLAGPLFSFPGGPLPRVAWASSWHDGGLPPEGEIPEDQEEITMPL